MPFPPPHQKFRITAWHDTLLAPRVRGVRPAAELARESGRGARRHRLRLSPLTGPRLPAGQGAVRILVTTSGWTLLSMYDSYH